MNPIDVLLSEPFGQTLGWTLLHFVWQGTLVALLLAFALYLLRRHTAQTRYVVACGALLLLLAMPVVTIVALLPDAAETTAAQQTPAMEPTTTARAQALPAAGVPAAPVAPASWQQEAGAMLAAALPWLVLLWMTGVLALSMRYLAGWTYTVRLRRRRTREVGQRWQHQLVHLARQLGVRRRVRLVSSALVQVPMVAGWLRPVILLPVSVFTGLSPRQIEMIIAHELAHIRRHDYLVGLLQAACETVFFYHPAVWWVSGRIRIEREHCCDDRVVSVCGDAYTYVAALAKMETVRQAAPRLAMAATGGSLLGRVRRLLEGPADPSPRAARWLAGLAVLAAFLLSLHLSSIFDDLWGKVQFWNAEESRVLETETTLPYLERQGYDQTAMRLEALVFDDLSASAQLDVLDELRALPPSASLPSLAAVAERHPRQPVRREAVEWLGRLGDAYVVVALERIAFEDRSTAVQMEALDALRNLPEKIGLPSLVKIAQTHPRAPMRHEAVQWIGRLGDEAARPILERILFQDASSSVQVEAFDALLNLRYIDTRVLQQLSETHSNARVRQEAGEWLARHWKQQRAAELLEAERALQQRGASSPNRNTHADTAERLAALIFEDESEAVQREALEALANLSAKASMPRLEQIAQTHRNEQIRNEAALRLTHVQEQADAAQEAEQVWDQALEDLKHAPASRRLEALRIISALRLKKPFRLLTEIAFNDPSVDVQMEALAALGNRGGLEAMAGIARVAREHPSAAMRAEAVQSMQAMSLDDQQEVLKEVIFNDNHRKVQLEALNVLANLPGEAAVPALEIIARRHPDKQIRNKTIRVLEALDEEDSFSDRMMATLDVIWNHPQEDARAEAVQELRAWSSVNVITILADLAYEDPSLEVQMEALNALRDRGDWDGTSWVVHMARNHPNAAMRAEAVQSLDDLDAKERLRLLDEIIFRDDDLDVRAEALDLLIDASEPEAVPILAKITRRENLPESLRLAAAEALEER